MTYNESTKQIQSLINMIQTNKVWETNEYNHGLLNGLILALATLEEKEPVFAVRKGVYHG